ncbi:hypothetical protein FRB97_004230 [Tulasnella sp. 331]|nr:hypothetical protein FRB97_004230 [Tulasnella sp. 331]
MCKAGNHSWDQFQALHSYEALCESITQYTAALSVCSIDHSHHPTTLNHLAAALYTRFGETGDMADLTASIQRNQDALPLCPIRHSHRPTILSDLGLALHTRFGQTRDIADLAASIKYHQDALVLRPVGHPGRFVTLNNLGLALHTRFGQTGDVADLVASIQCGQDALVLCPIGHPNRAFALNNLGLALYTRFGQTGDMADLVASIQYRQDALPLCPISHSIRSTILDNLGCSLYTRFGQTGDMADLVASIQYHQDALVLRPIGHPDRPSTLSNLGLALHARFGQTGDAADLVASIHYIQDALPICPVGYSLRSTILNNLGCSLYTRFGQTGDMADLVASIQYHQDALVLRPIGHPDRSSTLNNLGLALYTRFRQTGDMADLMASIQYNQDSLPLCPTGHSIRSVILSNLGVALHTRFGQTSDIADLIVSIQYHKDALTLRPIGHPDRSSTLNNLGLALCTRFGQTGDATDIVASIQYNQDALVLCPIGHALRSTLLNNLGCSFYKRFGQTGDISDLIASIQHHQDTLLLRPVGHPDRPSTLSSLGSSLCTRFRHTKDMADLAVSIQYNQDALLLCPIGHSIRSMILNNLAMALYERFGQADDPVDFDNSFRYLREGSEHPLSPLTDRLSASNNWIDLAVKHNSKSLGSAYASAMDLLDRSILLSASSIPEAHARMTQGGFRSQWRGITEDATSYAVKNHQLSTAVELSERGRALLFTHLGNYRTRLDDLEAASSNLTSRFRSLSLALEASTLSDGISMEGIVGAEDVVGRRQRLAADWDRTLMEIRQLEGFENFLRVAPFAQLKEAATGGPVVLVNISQYGSDAIIIHKTAEPVSIPLPDAAPAAIKALVHALTEVTADHPEEVQSNRILGSLLQDIWQMIVKPIISHLENTLRLRRGSRIWWILTSLACLLPIHAAGPYCPGELSLPDLYVSSYTPALSTLIRSRAGFQPLKRESGPQILVVAEPEAEGERPLPEIHREVALIRGLQAQVTVVEGEECTRDTVLASMKETAWVHFACHGHQHPTEPFRSHFSLHTRALSLTLLDIMKNNFPHVELAVLSACHSAAGNDLTPDEVIHLTSGMLFAGFRGVVGTMWAMTDHDGPEIAEDIYAWMFRNGPEAVDCRDSATALSKAVRNLRRKHVPFDRWINFVHYGI